MRGYILLIPVIAFKSIIYFSLIFVKGANIIHQYIASIVICKNTDGSCFFYTALPAKDSISFAVSSASSVIVSPELIRAISRTRS